MRKGRLLRRLRSRNLCAHSIIFSGGWGRRADYMKLIMPIKMIEVNRRLHTDPRIGFHVADINALPLLKKSCNGIFCFSCFPHFHNKPRVMRALTTVLKKGGWLILAHFDSPEALNHHHASSHMAVKHDRMPDEATIRSLFTGAGLTIVRHVNKDNFYAFLAKRK